MMTGLCVGVFPDWPGRGVGWGLVGCVCVCRGGWEVVGMMRVERALE